MSTNQSTTLLEAHFWGRFKQGAGCWEWLGHRNYGGYGVVNVKYTKQMAHRVSYMLTRGPIPKGLFVLHRCDNPGCVRPDHLFLGTIADNSHDMALKGRSGRRKLTPENAYAILWRAVSGESFSKLAAEYAVAR